jgi:acetyl-CoA carboxylase carboxyltransferase component
MGKQIHGPSVNCAVSGNNAVSRSISGPGHAEKIAAVMDLAAKNKTPIIGLNDSGGARIQEGHGQTNTRAVRQLCRIR